MFATKAKNRGKLDSHCWFFDAFSQAIQPEYCMLFDAGTRPRPFALRNIYAYFQRYPNVGAVTGELTVERPVCCVQTSPFHPKHTTPQSQKPTPTVAVISDTSAVH